MAPTDYDRDSATDIGIWRPSTSQWFDINSTDTSKIGPIWGASTGVPVGSSFLN